jgi:two-component sensor histidine kinase
MPSKLPGVSWTVDHWHELWRFGLRPGSIPAMTLALICVFFATVVRIELGRISPDIAAFGPYYSATLVVALAGGVGAASVAAALGGVIAYFIFILPEGSFSQHAATQIISLSLYGTSSFVIIWAAESHRALLVCLRQDERTRQLLTDELAHGVKNTLAVVQAIINYSVLDQPELRENLGARITALAKTNEILINSQTSATSFEHILRTELEPFDLSRFRLAGPDFICPSKAVVLLVLIFHELATNAAKYGALASETGRVHVSWSRIGEQLEVKWTEVGAGALNPRMNVGFGSKLLRSAAKQFNGTTDLKFEEDGLHCRMVLNIPENELSSPIEGLGGSTIVQGSSFEAVR